MSEDQSRNTGGMGTKAMRLTEKQLDALLTFSQPGGAPYGTDRGPNTRTTMSLYRRDLVWFYSAGRRREERAEITEEGLAELVRRGLAVQPEPGVSGTQQSPFGPWGSPTVSCGRYAEGCRWCGE